MVDPYSKSQRRALTANGAAILTVLRAERIDRPEVALTKRQIGGKALPERVNPAIAVERSLQKLREDGLVTRLLPAGSTSLARYYIAPGQAGLVGRRLEEHARVQVQAQGARAGAGDRRLVPAPG